MVLENVEVVDLREIHLPEKIIVENCRVFLPPDFDGVKHLTLRRIELFKESILLWNLTDLFNSYEYKEDALRVLNTTLHFIQLKPVSVGDFILIIQLLEEKIKGVDVDNAIIDRMLTRNHNLANIPDIFPEVLEVLDLSGNSIFYLPQSVLNSKIKMLSLSYNNFRNFPIRRGQFKFLEELSLDHNKLVYGCINLDRLPLLTYADLSSNLFDKIDSKILFSEGLINLNLSDNHIIKIPDNIASLINLEVLDLSKNYIERFNLAITSLTKLEYLNLSSTGILKIPLSIKNMMNLKFLYLANNSIVSISKGLSQIAKLEHLDISNNMITEFDLKLLDLLELDHLDISNNKMNKVPKDDRILNKKQRSFW